MRWTQWIWLAGFVAWTADGIIALRLHTLPHAELAFVMAAMFGIAFLFYRQNPRR